MAAKLKADTEALNQAETQAKTAAQQAGSKIYSVKGVVAPLPGCHTPLLVYGADGTVNLTMSRRFADPIASALGAQSTNAFAINFLGPTSPRRGPPVPPSAAPPVSTAPAVVSSDESNDDDVPMEHDDSSSSSSSSLGVVGTDDVIVDVSDVSSDESSEQEETVPRRRVERNTLNYNQPPHVLQLARAQLAEASDDATIANDVATPTPPSQVRLLLISLNSH